MTDMNPFWKGAFSELRKEAVVDQLIAGAHKVISGAAALPGAIGVPATAALGAGALGAGIGAVALKRKVFGPKPHVPAPAAKGFSGKALAGTALAAGAAGYYSAKKDDERR